MTTVHPTAIVDDGASLGSDVTVGPFCVIGPDVVVSDGVTFESHVAVDGHTEIGAGCHIYPFASLGHNPQDLKYSGEESRLIIGENTTIRENVTMNPGTEGGGLVTRVGSQCLLMVGAHIAHDCQLGNNVIMVNYSSLGGHVTIADNAIFGGNSAAHQFTRIGELAFVGGMTGVENDVIPFGMVTGNRASLSGLNLVGLKRAGVARDDIHALRRAYKMLFAEGGTLASRTDQVAEEYDGHNMVGKIIDFIRAGKDRGITVPDQAGG